MKLSAYREASIIWQSIANEIDDQELNFDMEAQKKLLNIFQVGEWQKQLRDFFYTQHQ